MTAVLDDTLTAAKIPETGTVVGGRYRLLAHLGTGGMGVAFEGEHIRLQRRVCVKFIKPERAAKEGALALFEGEAQSLARLSHPNIVGVYDFGEHDGFPFLVMELVEGESLESAMVGRPINLPFVLGVLRSIGSALSYMHANGMMHRDIKPSNVLVARDGTVKLADFGVAKLMEDDLGATGTGGIGTVVFAAPEVELGRRYDHRADIYSLGVTAHYLLTGKLPQQGVQPTQIHAALPPEIDVILAKALAPRPADRYELVRTFINDILNALHYESPLPSNENIRLPAVTGAPTPSAAQIEAAPTMIEGTEDRTESGVRENALAGAPSAGPTDEAAAQKERRMLLAVGAVSVLFAVLAATTLYLSRHSWMSGSEPENTPAPQEVPALKAPLAEYASATPTAAPPPTATEPPPPATPAPSPTAATPLSESPRIEGSAAVFVYEHPEAKNVMLVCDHNDWKGLRMYRDKENRNRWGIRLSGLKPGTYSYKFLVDDVWIMDPENNQPLEDDEGNVNSSFVIE